MIIDCHGHYTTEPSNLHAFRDRQLSALADPSRRPALANFKMVIGLGGGIRSRHDTSIGMDLGLPTGVLAQLRIIDALGNAHLLGLFLGGFLFHFSLSS